MKELYPYQTLFGDVIVQVRRVAIDDVPVRARIEPDSQTIDLTRVERADWERASFEVVVTAPASEIDGLPNATAIAILECGPANTRVAFELEPEHPTVGRWTGEVTLERDYWFGLAELRCGVAATVDGVPGRIVGWASTWNLAFDDLPDRPTVGGAIRITWLDFTNPGDRPYLRQHADKYFYISVDPHEPQLFLNKGFSGLDALLGDRPRRGPADRALHDQTRASIADKTWTALFNAALDFVDVDDEEIPQWPDVEWQRVVLESLLASMYPDASLDEALSNAYVARHTKDAGGALQELLAPAASAQARAPRLLRDGIRLLSNELVEDEEAPQ
ncbi:hypothetical protein ABQE44_25525 [Mycolicibacterium sp. XJ2546]